MESRLEKKKGRSGNKGKGSNFFFSGETLERERRKEIPWVWIEADKDSNKGQKKVVACLLACYK